MAEELKKKCRYCEKLFKIGQGEDWKFTCGKCYRKYVVPSKDRYTMAEINNLRDKIKKEIDSSL